MAFNPPAFAESTMFRQLGAERLSSAAFAQPSGPVQLTAEGAPGCPPNPKSGCRSRLDDLGDLRAAQLVEFRAKAWVVLGKHRVFRYI